MRLAWQFWVGGQTRSIILHRRPTNSGLCTSVYLSQTLDDIARNLRIPCKTTADRGRNASPIDPLHFVLPLFSFATQRHGLALVLIGFPSCSSWSVLIRKIARWTLKTVEQLVIGRDSIRRPTRREQRSR